MPRSLRTYLNDVQSALAEIHEFVDGSTLSSYVEDVRTRRAVERDFIIIGEAMSKMVHLFPESRSRIDHIRSIANFRHFLVHEYSDVDDRLVWDIALRSAPVLSTQIEAWIAELDEQQPQVAISQQ